MKIIRVETLRPLRRKNLCLVRLHTDGGWTGLGESFFGSRAAEAYIHESVPPLFLGLHDSSPELVTRELTPFVGYQGGGVETRGNGAIDTILRDFLTKRAGLPLGCLFGGPVRRDIATYSTRAGTRYINAAAPGVESMSSELCLTE